MTEVFNFFFVLVQLNLTSNDQQLIDLMDRPSLAQLTMLRLKAKLSKFKELETSCS